MKPINDLPSLQLIADEVRDQIRELSRHGDALDAKAGILLGFAGAIVALGARDPTPIDMAGMAGAALAALFALKSSLPRPFPAIELRELRGWLVRSNDRTELELLDTRIQMAEEVRLVLRVKLRWMRASMWTLLASVIVVVVAAILGGTRSAESRVRRSDMAIEGTPAERSKQRKSRKDPVPPFRPNPNLIGHAETGSDEARKKREKRKLYR